MAIHLAGQLPDQSCNLPEHLGKIANATEVARVPIWSCSEWGLPCQCCCQRLRCALTAPFHPYHASKDERRFVFCGTFPRVAPAGRYPAF